MLREHAQDADLLINDAQYTPEEYEKNRRGWGHSTWLEAARLAHSARVKHLVLFHHDPSRDDAGVAFIAAQAQAEFRATVAAREGFVAEV